MIRRDVSLLLGVLTFLVGALLALLLARDCARWGGSPLCAEAPPVPEAVPVESEYVPILRTARPGGTRTGGAVVGTAAEDSSGVLLSGLEERVVASVVAPPRSTPWRSSVERRRAGVSEQETGSLASPPELSPAPAVQPEPQLSPTSVPVPQDPQAMRRLVEGRYPQHLKESGVGGTVVLALAIDTRGRVRDPKVIDGSGNEALDAAALEVVRQVRFTPALQNGGTVATQILFPLVFTP